MLDIKKTLSKLLKYKKVAFTPLAGAIYTPYDGCFYEKNGTYIHLHLGLSGLIQNSANVVCRLPEEIRPKTRVFGQGSAGSVGSQTIIEIFTSGEVYVYPSGGTYCGADVFYIVGGVAHRLLNLLTSKRGWAVC